MTMTARRSRAASFFNDALHTVTYTRSRSSLGLLLPDYSEHETRGAQRYKRLHRPLGILRELLRNAA
jgi:hypothetical protein